MSKLKSSKKSLEYMAKSNVSSTLGTKDNQKTLKSGNPVGPVDKHKTTGNVVGASLGVTKNMDNYESLRVDVWLTDEVQEDETPQQAYDRILGVLDKVLQDTVESYV